MSTVHYPIETDDDRSARHFYVLKSLTDRGYELAIKAADCAGAQLEAAAVTPEPAAPNHHQTFERYVRLIRLLVGVEHRIAQSSGAAPKRIYRPAAGPLADMRPDPRRPMMHEFVQRATRNSPDRAELRRAVTAAADEAIDRDPAFDVPAAELLFGICKEYGLHFDVTKLPDAFLETPALGPVGPVRYNEAAQPIEPTYRMAPSG